MRETQWGKSDMEEIVGQNGRLTCLSSWLHRDPVLGKCSQVFQPTSGELNRCCCEEATLQLAAAESGVVHVAMLSWEGHVVGQE